MNAIIRLAKAHALIIAVIVAIKVVLITTIFVCMASDGQAEITEQEIDFNAHLFWFMQIGNGDCRIEHLVGNTTEMLDSQYLQFEGVSNCLSGLLHIQLYAKQDNTLAGIELILISGYIFEAQLPSVVDLDDLYMKYHITDLTY